MIITLTSADALLAVQAGAMRNIENIRKGRVAAYGAAAGVAGDFQMHILGAMGEFALAQMLNVCWHGKGRFRGPDVGHAIQVRTSERGGRVSLILHPDDSDDMLYYCVRRIDGTLDFKIYQPVWGRDGKVTANWRDDVPHPAFFVPVQ